MTQDLSEEEKCEGRSYRLRSWDKIIVVESGTLPSKLTRAVQLKRSRPVRAWNHVTSTQTNKPTNEQTEEETVRRTRELKYFTPQKVTLKHPLPSIQSVPMTHR